MGTSVSLPGPSGTSIALQYGATGIPTVTVTDPAFPRGGFSGPLEAGYITTSINEIQSDITNSNNAIARAQNNIKNASQLVVPGAVPSFIKQQEANIATETRYRTLSNNSMQQAVFVLNNLKSLTDQLKVANATNPNTNTTSSIPAANQKPTQIASTTPTPVAPKTTTKPATTTATSTPAPAITNTVPNPKLTTNTPVPPIVTPIITKTVAKPTVTAAPTTTAPSTTAVPNPKLTTNTPVPPIVTAVPTIKAGPAPIGPIQTTGVTPVPIVTAGSPALIPAPRILPATITNPFVKPAPAYQTAIVNTVPNPVLKPPTDASIKSLITPTPTIKVEQPALIPSPPVVAPTITNPFAPTAPDPNAIVNAVPNPKLNTKPLTPKESTAISLAAAKPVTTVTAGTPALIPATPKDQLVVTPVISAGTPALVEAPKIDAATIVNPFDAPKIVAEEPLAGDDIVDEIPNPDFEDEFGGADGLSGDEFDTAVQPTQQDQLNFEARKDWRVRLALSPGSDYFYNAPDSNILQPLLKTDGVVFPYTPTISVSYSASYESLSPVHSNYKINQYTNSSVDSVSITCDFTAQDAAEAKYLLAVIHFFRSMTKMFYGQDKLPKNGTPPPLCYLFGMGEFQFSALPLAITGFNYTLPNDVDYIKTTAASPAGTPQEAIRNSSNSGERLGPDIGPGGIAPPPDYGATPSSAGVAPTYVPTRIQLAITCLPMMSRNMVSNKFSLREYANGNLLRGTVNPGGGMW